MRKAVRNRILFYGGFVTATGGFYLYQPVRIDLFPRAIPALNPTVEPDLRHLFSAGARVAVLTAHPDDSEFYAGALLAKLQKTRAKVTLVVLTDGAKGFYPWIDAAAYGRIRRAEQTAAARAWGAERVEFLHFRDGRLRNDEASVERAAAGLRGAEWVVSFDGDFPPKVAHGDHRVAGDIAERAARDAGARWLVRFATHAPNGTFDLTGFDLAHRSLLDIHKSQFSGEKEAQVWGTVFEGGLTDGVRIEKEYGLSFRATKLR